MIWPLDKDICPSEFLEENECILWKNWTSWSFLYLCWRHCLPSRIFCIKAVIVACLHAVSNSWSVQLYKQREQATKTDVKQNISLWIKAISKNLGAYHNVKMQSEHNETLDVTKYLKISAMKRFYKTNETLDVTKYLKISNEKIFQNQFCTEIWTFPMVTTSA